MGARKSPLSLIRLICFSCYQMPSINYIQEFLDYLRFEVDASPMTIENYGKDLWAFLAYVEARQGEPFVPSQQDLDLVRGWLSHKLDTGSKASSVGKYLSSLSMCLLRM